MNENTSLPQELKQAKIAYYNALLYARFQAGFLGRVSHEIRSPLGSLMSIHQLIINDLCESPEEEKEFIAEAYNYAKKLMDMLDELIEISKLEAGRFELELMLLNCVDFLTFVKNTMKVQAANRNVSINIAQVDPQLLILGDRQKLAQVFFYWLEVAIDVCELGKITLSADAMAPENQTRLTIELPFKSSSFNEPSQFHELPFEEIKGMDSFPRLSNGTKITLAQSLVRLMGGQFKVSNGTEKTTCLEIFLPNSETV